MALASLRARAKRLQAAKSVKAGDKPALSDRARQLLAAPLASRVERILTDRRKRPVTIDATQRRWFALLEYAHARGMHAGIMAPRGSGKTSVLVVGVTADAIGQDPHGSRQIASVAAPTATKRVGAVRRIIATSAAFREMYPDARPDPDEWNKTEIRILGSTSLDPTLVGFGVTSESVGSRSTGTVLDDVDGSKSLSPLVRERIRDTLDSQVLPTLEQGARVLMVCTAWHEEDYAHTKIRERDWCWVVDGISDDCRWVEYVVIEGGKPSALDLGELAGEPCEPTAWGIKRFAREFGCVVRRVPLYGHFDREELWRRRGDGAEPKRSFRRGYQQDAYTDEERWFPSFERCVHYGVGYESLAWQSWRFMFGVDLSSKKRPGNFVVAVGEASDGRKILADARFGAWTSYQTAQQIADAASRFKPEAIEIESVALQDALAEWIVATRGAGMGSMPSWWASVKGYETKGNVHTDEEHGVRALEIEFANDAWVILVPHEKRVGCDCGMCELVRQFTQHPHGKQRDAVMALWFAREGFRMHQPTGAVVTGVNEPPHVHIQERRDRFHKYESRR